LIFFAIYKKIKKVETKYIVNNISGQTINGNLQINGNLSVTGTTITEIIQSDEITFSIITAFKTLYNY